MIVSQKHYRGTVYIAKVDYVKEEFDNIWNVTTLLFKVTVRMIVSHKHYRDTVYIAKIDLYYVILL